MQSAFAFFRVCSAFTCFFAFFSECISFGLFEQLFGGAADFLALVLVAGQVFTAGLGFCLVLGAGYVDLDRARHFAVQGQTAQPGCG